MNSELMNKDGKKLDSWKNQINEIASTIESTIETIKMHEYESFFHLFYVPSVADKEFNFILNEIKYLKGKVWDVPINVNTISRISDLKVQLSYLQSFHNLFFNNNIEHMKFIQENILKPKDGYVYQLNIFDLVKNLNRDVSTLVYRNINVFESFLKIVIVSVMTNLGYSFDKASSFKIGSLQKHKELNKLKSNPELEPKKNWVIFNEMTLSEVINFLNNISDEKLLKAILINLVGQYKFDSYKNGISTKSTKEIRTEIVDQLNMIKELRNDVMHFDMLLPAKNNNKLMRCVRAMVHLSKSQDGANDQYLSMHSQLLSIITNFMNLVPDRQIMEYFQKNILSFEIY